MARLGLPGFKPATEGRLWITGQGAGLVRFEGTNPLVFNSSTRCRCIRPVRRRTASRDRTSKVGGIAQMKPSATARTSETDSLRTNLTPVSNSAASATTPSETDHRSEGNLRSVLNLRGEVGDGSGDSSQIQSKRRLGVFSSAWSLTASREGLTTGFPARQSRN